MLSFNDMQNQIINNVSILEQLKNPGKGISTIKKFEKDKVFYSRKNSTYSFSLRTGYDILQKLKRQGKNTISTNDLKNEYPEVFNSKKCENKTRGHDCNCTLLFMLLDKAGIVDRIHGKGRANNAFFINLDSF